MADAHTLNAQQERAEPVAIRLAAPDDLPSLVRLCAAHAAFERAAFEPVGKESRLAALLFGPNPRLFCVVAERDKQLVGYATWAREASTWDASEYAHIDCLYVAPEERSGGIGQRLVALVARQALSAGCGLLQWQTPAFNTRAMRFYRRLGATKKEKVRFFLDAREMHRLAAQSDPIIIRSESEHR